MLIKVKGPQSTDDGPLFIVQANITYGIRSFIQVSCRGWWTLSPCQCIHNNVHSKSCVVYLIETFIAKIVIPFATVVLIAIQHTYLSIDFDGPQIIMNDVVTPPVELLGSGGRSIKFKED